MKTTAALFTILSFSGLACATAPRPAAAPETVGQLAPSYASITTAPIHHDEPPEMGQVVETGDDPDNATESITTTSAASAADVRGDGPARTGGAGAETVELPDVVPKTDGVTIPGAR